MFRLIFTYPTEPYTMYAAIARIACSDIQYFLNMREAGTGSCYLKVH